MSKVLLEKEYAKKIAIAAEKIEIQNQIKADLSMYRNDYLKFVKEDQEEHQRFMVETKMTYEYLFAEQDSILNEHKKQIAVTESAPTGTKFADSTTTSTKPTTTLVKKKVSKPAATRTTKTS